MMHYKTNFLTSVICRIDLLEASELGGPNRPALSAAVADMYPRYSAKPNAQVSLIVGPQGPQMTQGVAGFSFEHRRGEKSMPLLVIGSNLISLEYGQGDYDHFPPFKGEIDGIISALIKNHPKAVVSRVGLRYINEIRFDAGNALDWKGLIDPNLEVSAKAGIPTGMKLAKSMHQLQVFNDDLTMLIHYGLPNPDFPGELVRRHFVLDIDAFKTGPFSVPEAPQCVATLNAACEAAFESYIAGDLRDKMGVINA